MDRQRKSLNIASYLPAMARAQPEAMAVACPDGRDADGETRYRRTTFRQLDDESDLLALGLEAIGIRCGVRAVLMVPPSLELFVLTYALFKLGAVPVMADPGMGTRNLGVCLAEAEPEAFVGVPRAHAARLLFGWARASLHLQVTVGRKWLWGGLTYDQVRERGRAAPPRPYKIEPTGPDETAAILFTSGSTGVPKGAVYTHANFASQVEALRATYDIRPGEVDLPTFPLFALFDPALGMSAVVPEMDFTRPARVDPERIFEPVRRLEVTNLFASPALLDRVGRAGAAARVKLPSLRRVVSAGAPVAAPVIERFASLVGPECEIHTPYGATEALPVSTIGSRTILGETRKRTEVGAGVCVGRPVAGVRVAVIPISDQPIARWSDELLLPSWEVGEIAVRGPVVTRSYYGRPESTVLAKIPAGDGGEVWHRMGDLGYLDADGRIWFCGRKSQRVITPAGTLYTIPCEAVFNTHPDVFRSALVGVPVPAATEALDAASPMEPVLVVELEPDARRKPADLERIRRELLARGAAHPHTSAIRTVLFHRAFPVDVRHNAKIGREKLAAWAARRVKHGVRGRPPAGPAGSCAPPGAIPNVEESRQDE